MENKVKKLLIKWGNSEDTANEMIKYHLGYAVTTYPDANPAFIANLLSYF